MISVENSVLDISNNYYGYLMNLENVNGVGLGYKYVNGINTFEICIHILVDKKVNEIYLSKRNLIPKYYMGIKTDVIEVGKARPLSDSVIPNKFEKLEGGGSISCISSERTGTLGCIVRKKKLDYFQYFILTNNHVVTEFETVSIGTPIIHPGFKCGGEFPQNVVGNLKDFKAINYLKKLGDEKPDNEIDAAIIKIYNKSFISNKVHLVGNLKGSNTAKLGETVTKIGFKTGKTSGKVETIGLTKTLNMGTLDKPKLALFKNQIEASLIADAGDSGSIVINSNNEAIGLLFSANVTKGMAYMNDINKVLSEFNIEINSEEKIYTNSNY